VNVLKQAMQQTVSKAMDNIERNHMRPLQRNAFLCMANCFTNKHHSHEQVVNCQQNCSAPIQNAQQVVEQEIGTLQERLQRGLMQCRDAARDMVPPKAKETDPAVAAAQRAMDDCAVKCIHAHTGMVKQVEARIIAAMR
jgi:Eukaryotic protein of unknown function (DUF842)